MQKRTIAIALGFLLTGFISSYLLFGYQKQGDSSSDSNDVDIYEENSIITNPFITKDHNLDDSERIGNLENEVILVKQQLLKINKALQELTKSTDTKSAASSIPIASNRSRYASALNQRLYNLENLIKGGIDPFLAEDIVSRKNSIELKRLEIQDRATREGYLNTQRYFDELEVINKDDVSLRQELGDDRYDEYLYTSKQNNRIKITSVIPGSAAEKAGIEKGDIVLNYGDSRMFTWQELKDATSEGQLGEYVAINVYRNGEVYSFSVPRGPLGMQLGSTRLEP